MMMSTVVSVMENLAAENTQCRSMLDRHRRFHDSLRD